MQRIPWRPHSLCRLRVSLCPRYSSGSSRTSCPNGDEESAIHPPIVLSFSSHYYYIITHDRIMIAIANWLLLILNWSMLILQLHEVYVQDLHNTHRLSVLEETRKGARRFSRVFAYFRASRLEDFREFSRSRFAGFRGRENPRTS